MRVRVLGCSGGIGDGRHTTSFLVDDDILVDCGTGVTTLTHAELCRIDHVFLTHSHLDHILGLPLLLDSAAGERASPVTVHALPETLATLQSDIFNWRVWPDFARLPSADAPFLRYRDIAVGTATQLGARSLTALPANHVVPACGFHLRGSRASLMFSGDTASHQAFWDHANACADLAHIVVECSFEDALADIAAASKHYYPASLAADLARLESAAALHITHLKPGGEAVIMAELARHGITAAVALAQGETFEL